MCMITFEIDRASANVNVFNDGKTAELSLISSRYKKRHYGTAVMKKVLDYADAFDLELVLEVHPFGDAPNKMDEAELKSWYMTFDFVLEGDGVMSRKRKSERTTTPIKDSVADWVGSMERQNPE